MEPTRVIAYCAAAAVAAGAIALVLQSRASSASSASAGLPAAARPFTIPRPRLLAADARLLRWAPVRHATVVRAAPRPSAKPIAAVGRRTPEGTANIVLAEGRTRATSSGVWLHVRAPGGVAGWIARSALGGYTLVRTRLLIERDALRATLYRDGRVLLRARVAVGRPSAPTPAGRYYVRDRLAGYRSPMYGPVAFGTSAQAPGATAWPAGGFVGIHGTDAPQLVPGRVSHGCIRLRNPDIERLARLMPVGTPITIV